jgi:hypothetical protein
MPTQTASHNRPDEQLGVRWHPKRWLSGRNTSIRAASRIAGVSDTSIHLWDQHGLVPLSFFKTCVLQFGGGQQPPQQDVVSVATPFKVTDLMLEGAALFDRRWPGQYPPVAVVTSAPRQSGVRKRRPNGSRAAAPVVTTPAAPRKRGRPPKVRVDAPTPVVLAPAARVAPVAPPVAPPVATPAAETDLLLSLLLQVTGQRDQLANRVYVLETQRRTEDQLRTRIAELERELLAYKELADLATSPTALPVAPVKAEPAVAARVERMLQQRAPSLVDELRNLPRVGVA